MWGSLRLAPIMTSGTSGRVEFYHLSSGYYVFRVEAREREQETNRVVVRRLLDVVGERTARFVMPSLTPICMCTDVPLTLMFVNNSPLVEGNLFSLHFVTSKPIYSAICRLGRELTKDCTNGSVQFDDVPPATYPFRVVAWDKRHFGHRIVKRLTVHVLGK